MRQAQKENSGLARSSADAPRNEVLLRRLKSYGSVAEAAAASALGSAKPEVVAAGDVLFHEGQPRLRPRYVLSGWACLRRSLPDGRQQILELLLPGDIIGLDAGPSSCTKSHIAALTSMTWVDANVADKCDNRTKGNDIKNNPTRSLDEEHAWLLEQIIRLGCLVGRERVAHLLLELHERLHRVGLVVDDSFVVPLTQEVLGDVLGLSIVHVNRALQQLRRENLIEWKGNRVRLINRLELAALSAYKNPLELRA